MTDDLDSFLTASAPAPSAQAGAVDPATDLAVRTAYIEAGNQPPAAQQAVISTAVNRAKALGEPLQSVIMAPGQYSAWSDPSLVARAQALSPNDPAYKAIQSTIQPVLSGQVTLPYTNYLNRASTPPGSSALSTWAAKPGAKIGDQEFYSLPVTGASAPQDLGGFLGASAASGTPSGGSASFLSGIGADGGPAAPAPSAGTPAASSQPASATFLQTISGAGDGSGVDTPTGLLFTDGSPVTSQKLARAYLAFSKTKAYDPKAAPGSEAHPYGQKVDVAPVPGAWYIGSDGSSYQASQADADAYAKAGQQEQMNTAGGATFNGMLQGFAPEVTGAARYIASGGDPRAYAQGANVAQAQLDAYRAAHPLVATLAQGGGSLVTGALGMEGLGAVAGAARVPALLGPTGEFLSGTAGAAGAADASLPAITGNMLLQTGSKVANAGLQGATFGAMSSHLNPDTPLAEQVGLGAAGGVALAGAGQLARGAGNLLMQVPAVADAVNSFTQPLTAAGRDAIANRAIQAFAEGGPTAIDATELVPGSTPTLATATGNRGLMAAEKALRATPEGANVFGARDVANDTARQAYLSSIQGDNDTLAELQAARAQGTAPLQAAAFSSPQPTASTPVVRAIDQILASPSGKLDDVAGPLNSVRVKLFNDDAGMSEADQSALHQAVMSSMGSDAASPTPAAMSAVKSRLSDVFDQVAAKTELPLDDALKGHLGAILGDAGQVLSESEVRPLRAQIGNVLGFAPKAAEVEPPSAIMLNGKAVPFSDLHPNVQASLLSTMAPQPIPDGTISGESYQALTRKGAPLDRAMSSSDPNIKFYANQIRDALDDSLERAAPPEDVGALQQARGQYRNMKIVQGALDKTAPGDALDPGALLSSVRRAYPNFSYTGGGTLGDTAVTGLQAASRPATAITDPEQLFGVRRALDQVIENRSGLPSEDEGLQHLTGVRDALDNAIERGAPGYRDFIAQYGDLSKPINAQNFLLNRGMTDARGTPTLAKTQSTLDAIARGQRQPGVSSAKDVTDQTVQAIRSLRDELARSNLTPDRNVRSDTVQNLASNALLAKASIPTAIASFHVPGVGFVRNALSGLYDAQNQKVANVLLGKMLDPELGATAFQATTPRPSGGNLLLRAISANAADDYGANRRRAALVAP